MSAGECDEENLGFFDRLFEKLKIDLSESRSRVEGLLVEKAPPSAQITGVSLIMEVDIQRELFANLTEEQQQRLVIVEDDGPLFRELTEEEWKRVVIRTPAIRMRGESGQHVIEHQAPDGASFTMRDLASAIAETERRTRGYTNWVGGIDVHHVLFDGIELGEDGVWQIKWGS